MNKNEKNPESTVVIRFPDCDPFNHLNNSRYLDYFLNAREDHIDEYYGFSIYRYTRETGRGWVVGMNQISYFKPALLMERVAIQSTLLQFSDRDILLEMRMYNQDKSKIKALLWSRFFHIDLTTQKSIAHGSDVMEIFKPLVNPLEGDPSFEERSTQLRAKN